MNNIDNIKLGTHGENYGNWMSSIAFKTFGLLLLFSIILTVLFSVVFPVVIAAVIFAVISLFLIFMLALCVWIRKQYAFGGGGLMDKIHQRILSDLDYDGNGTLLDVGCGSGPLAIRAALTWKNTKAVGIDYWGSSFDYSKSLCEKNAESEGVADRCIFQKGDARKLDFTDESFDAVVSNYVFHNIMGADKQELILESLRVLKKGGVFAFNDSMKPNAYGNMEEFVQKLKGMGYSDVRLINTSELIFGSEKKASLMMLGNSRMLIGRK